MMYHLMGFSVSALLLLIALVHFYWAFFSQNPPSAKVIPFVDGKPAFLPSRTGTCLVAIAILFMGLFVAELTLHSFQIFPTWLMQFIGTAIAFGFLARSVGDFRLVGFFKKIKDSEFATYDIRFWSPLCVLIAICILYIAWS